MGTIVLHVGMPKAGSSSLQRCLARVTPQLRDRGFLPILATEQGSEARHGRRGVHLEPFDPVAHFQPGLTMGGGFNSGQFVDVYMGFKGHRPLLDRFMGELDEHARTGSTVVLSAEGLFWLISPDYPDFTPGLEALAQVHEVRVAYYVRPQHGSLISAWTQWGYRRGQPPSDFLEWWAARLDYRSVLDYVRATAPTVAFDLRPFRSELLEGGTIAIDFARRSLRIDDLDEDLDEWANPGLPLELANLLRPTPAGASFVDDFDNPAFERRQAAVAGWEVPESARTRRGRGIVHRHAYDRFEADNQAIADDLRWATDHFVGEPGPEHPDGDLRLVDELWDPGPSTADREVLYAVLQHLARRDRPRPIVR